jgi:hypothetical protein
VDTSGDLAGDYTQQSVKRLMCNYAGIRSKAETRLPNYNPRTRVPTHNSIEEAIINLADMDTAAERAGLTPRQKLVYNLLSRGYAERPGQTVPQWAYEKLGVSQPAMSKAADVVARKISRVLLGVVI